MKELHASFPEQTSSVHLLLDCPIVTLLHWLFAVQVISVVPGEGLLPVVVVPRALPLTSETFIEPRLGGAPTLSTVVKARPDLFIMYQFKVDPGEMPTSKQKERSGH